MPNKSKSTKPYSETEFLADPGFDRYDADPKPKPKHRLINRLRIIPNQRSTDILMLDGNRREEERFETTLDAGQEGMSTLHPMPVEDNREMDVYTNLYVGSLSIVGLYVLFRVLYR
jgi:hypothetical protein